MKYFIIILFTTILSSCTQIDNYFGTEREVDSITAANRNYELRTNPIIKFNGFSINREKFTDKSWLPGKGTLNIWGLMKASPTYSFRSSVYMYPVPVSVKTLEDIKTKHSDSLKSNTVLESHQQIISYKGIQQLRYYYKILDKNPTVVNKGLILVVNGYICIHPSKPNLIVRYEYSERGKMEEVKKELYKKDGLSFLDSITIN